MTDPARTPDPFATIAHLPRGACVIYRHFGAPDRASLAARLAAACRRRGLIFLIAADPPLARLVRADGVHWPERLMPPRRAGFRFETTAAHSPRALRRAAAAGMDAAILSPVFATASVSRGAPRGSPQRSPQRSPLGPRRAGAWARAARLPVFALGGINVKSARSLPRASFAGLAAVEALASSH